MDITEKYMLMNSKRIEADELYEKGGVLYNEVEELYDGICADVEMVFDDFNLGGYIKRVSMNGRFIHIRVDDEKIFDVDIETLTKLNKMFDNDMRIIYNGDKFTFVVEV